jgi:hypothetical protein
LCYATAFRNNEERQYRKTHHKCFSNGRKVSSLFLKKTVILTLIWPKRFEYVDAHPSGTLAKDGIFMNAVDTGWVTDEDPAELARNRSWKIFNHL